MTDTLTPVLTAHWDQPDIFTIDGYRRAAAGRRCRRRWPWTRDEVITRAEERGLRGRGGAGFATGVKWSFLPQGDGKPHYLVVNADESEPGTCKDVPLMMANPHVLIEGAAITGVRDPGQARVHLRPRRGAARGPAAAATRCEEAYAAGYLGQNILGSGFDLDVIVHAGAGAYICGEETALLDLARGLPRPAAAAAAVPGRGGPVRLPDA